MQDRRNKEQKEVEVDKKKKNTEGPKLAMEVEKQGKASNQRIRNCILALLQGAVSLGTETQKRNELRKRNRKRKS